VKNWHPLLAHYRPTPHHHDDGPAERRGSPTDRHQTDRQWATDTEPERFRRWCVPARSGYPIPMGSNVGGRAGPQARLGGHLLALVGDRNFAALSSELSPLVAPAGPESAGRADYGGVLTWLVTALADVVVARLGPAQEGESFVLEVRHHRRPHRRRRRAACAAGPGRPGGAGTARRGPRHRPESTRGGRTRT
jgi:hypothetical protein